QQGQQRMPDTHRASQTVIITVSIIVMLLVSQAAFWEASSRAARVTSSGIPSRPSGIAAAICRRTPRTPAAEPALVRTVGGGAAPAPRRAAWGGGRRRPAWARVAGDLGAVGAGGGPGAGPTPVGPPVATATTPAGPGGRAACCWRASVVSSCVAGAHCRA